MAISRSLVKLECENEGSAIETASVIAKRKVLVSFGPPCTNNVGLRARLLLESKTQNVFAPKNSVVCDGHPLNNPPPPTPSDLVCGKRSSRPLQQKFSWEGGGAGTKL